MGKGEEKVEVGDSTVVVVGIDAPFHSISITVSDVAKVVYFVSCRPHCV